MLFSFMWNKIGSSYTSVMDYRSINVSNQKNKANLRKKNKYDLTDSYLLKCDKEISLSRKQLYLIKKFLLIAVLRSIHGEAFMQKENGSYKNTTYSEYRDMVEELGTELYARGYAGSRIIVMGDNSLEWATVYMATVCGVGVIVPVDKELPIEEIAYVEKSELESIEGFNTELATELQNRAKSYLTKMKLIRFSHYRICHNFLFPNTG